MLVLDIFQNAKGDIAVQYNPKEQEIIGRLREGLGNYTIENPLITFANRYNGDYYKNASEDELQLEAWATDTLGELWKDTENDQGQAGKDVFTILSRLTNAYLSEHEELLRLREEVQHQPSKREKKDKRSGGKKRKKDAIEDVIEDISDYYLDEAALEPFDFYAFGVGYCASKYGAFLTERKHIENEIDARCHQDRSDEGIVRYNTSSVPYRQEVTVIFTNEEPFTYEVQIIVDTYADDKLDIESIYDQLSAHDSADNEIPMSFSVGGLRYIRAGIEKIEGAEELCVGVRLSYKISFKNDVDEISSTKMQNLYASTKGMRRCVEEAIKCVTSK